ncbi:hypothetical protein HPB50_028536 [Hyalomma asiaticum]|nr:hypothetical protein HPB50_028536 [Hyalomma asiaticum]
MLTDLDLFQYAYYSPRRLCFFTKMRVENRMTFIDSSVSLLQCAFALTLAAFLVVLSVRINTVGHFWELLNTAWLFHIEDV